MMRILVYIAIVLGLALGFTWLADRPGELVLTFAGYHYQVSLLVACVLLVAIFSALLISWWILKGLWHSPYTVSRYFRVRRRDRGYQALSTGLIAAGSGDGSTARRMGKQAAKMISSDQEPLIHLLEAQTAVLEGDYETARFKFEQMSKDPETRLLGLRGLFLEASRLGDRVAAHHFAEQAASQAPQLAWAVNSALESRAASHDWSGALALLDAQKSGHISDRKQYERRRAILLTAQANKKLLTDPNGAKTAALEAVRLQPDFVPASLIAAQTALHLNELRRAVKILEAIWKRVPHPEVAELYTHLRHGDSTHDQLERARRLRKIHPNHVESELAVSRAALGAGEMDEARDAAESAIRLDPREGAYLLLADIEEATTGEQGKIRHWLSKAVRSPQDPAWVADGIVSEHWAPVSPVTGALDAFEWRVPAERLGPLVESQPDHFDDELAEAIHSEAAKALPAASEIPPVAEETMVAITAPAPSTVATEPVITTPQSNVNPARPAQDLPDTETKPIMPPPYALEVEELSENDVIKHPPLPDDPGVEPQDQDEAAHPHAFRLF